MQALKLLLTTPLMWVWYVLMSAVILLRGTRRDRHMRIGWYALVAGFLLLTLLSLTPVSNALTRPLLRLYSAPSLEMLVGIDVITVLGGGGRQGKPSEVTYERIIAGIGMFKQSGAKFLVVQGASDIDGELTDGEIMKSIALEQGVPTEKIFVDSHSHTTVEHPLQLEELLPADVARIGIVTSALHMPRAMAVFRHYFTDKTLVALPVGLPIERLRFRFVSMIPSIDALANSTAALHEWAGFIWYKIRFLV